MNIVTELLHLCLKVINLCAVFGGATAVLCLIRWAYDLHQGSTKKQMKRQQFGGGHVLGRASSSFDTMKAVRDARLANNRFQMKVTMAKEGKRKMTTRDRPPTPSPPPSCSSSQTRSPSPRSVVELQNESTLTLPEELRPESTKHFFVQGATKFIALPTTSGLKRCDDAVEILRQLAREFMPIIHRRGFNIRSVSEMASCGDGLEYELGGERRSIPAGEQIVGNDHDTIAGYNGKLISHFGGRPEYVIHLRLRSVDNSKEFMNYDKDIVDTMAHELAHCVYEDHGPEFWDLMEEILRERAKIVQSITTDLKSSLSHDPSTVSKEQFNGFDIYQTVSGQLRNWNGQVTTTAPVKKHAQ